MTAAGQLRFWRKGILPVLAIMLLALYEFRYEGGLLPDNDAEVSGAQVAKAYREQRSGVWVTVSGRVVRILPDDSEGSRHQRFILQIDSQHTVLIAHNIDIAKRVPLKIGNNVAAYGQYEWNERGGVIHWTHHNPGDDSKGGWIEYQGNHFR